jgi:hypothetical protein
MGFRALTAFVSGAEPAEPDRQQDRRIEPRHDCCGLKIIIRERRTLGILHLRNLSTWGACGITDMPLPEGSLVFLELKKHRFFGARVKWVNRMTLGLQLCRPMTPEMLEALLKPKKRSAR